MRRVLAAYRPAARVAPARAAVALVLRPGAGGAGDVLLIERAEKDGDPWSGHMALPGGRQDRRRSGSPVHRRARDPRRGRARSARGRAPRPARRPRRAPRGPARRPRDLRLRLPPARGAAPRRAERRSAARVLGSPRAARSSPRATSTTACATSSAPSTCPGIRVGDAEGHVVWGLTYRFLESFLGSSAAAPATAGALSSKPLAEKRPDPDFRSASALLKFGVRPRASARRRSRGGRPRLRGLRGGRGDRGRRAPRRAGSSRSEASRPGRDGCARRARRC